MRATRGDYLARVKALEAFDAHCWLGETAGPRLAREMRATSAGELLALLDRAGISRAVVFHTLAVHGDARLANEALLREVAGEARLIPGAVSLPDDARDGGIERLIGRGVRLAAIHPSSHGFSLEAWCSGEMLTALEARRLPVIVPHTEVSWSAVEKVCREHPALPVLVEGGAGKLIYHNRVLYALMRERGNLHLLLDALVGWRMVDDLARRFGPERLLFSSQLPLRDPNVGLGMLAWGEMDEGAKRRIAHQNLDRLVAGVKL